MQTIRELSTPQELEDSASVIRNAFQAVADEFGVTRKNNPDHGAFIEVSELRELQEKGAVFFGLFDGIRQTGFVSVRQASWKETAVYLEKLAVSPEARNRGGGRKLLDSVCRYARDNGKKSILIGIINEYTVLKKWYIDRGYREIVVKNYPHLPFAVCHMEKEV